MVRVVCSMTLSTAGTCGPAVKDWLVSEYSMND